MDLGDDVPIHGGGSTEGLVERCTVATNGIELSVLVSGPVDGDVVVLCHGFPELAHSWRHQIDYLASAGYRVLAPDMRGYGQSSIPTEVEAYDIVQLTGDVAGLLDHVGAERAVIVGHDWGANVAWQFALLHPARTRAVAALSVPFLARSEHPPIATMRVLFEGKFFYILHFQEPGVADAELAADVRETMLRLFGGLRSTSAGFSGALAGDDRGFVQRLPAVDGPPEWLGADDLAVYVESFERTGFTGGLNWYRCMDRNWELTAGLAGARVTVPACFIAGAEDPVIAMWPVAAMADHLDDLRATVLIDGAGHWVQQERPVEVNEALLAFLRSL